MKKTLILILVALILVGIAFAMMTRGPERPWTTDSDEALAQLERGLESLMKSYYESSAEYFEAALDLDPDFAAAKVLLLYSSWEREGRERIIEELRQVDVRRLTARERFLVEFTLAKADRDSERADAVIEEYIASTPSDPLVLMTCSTEAWEKRDWDRAARHYRKLIETDPNWVNAQNRLGYIAMAQGKFEEAEEAFAKYHYIAPDQANPHDSMGELLTLLGRYDEAKVAFEKAVEISPDFCIGYYHLADMYIMSGNLEPIDEVLERAEKHCDEEFTSFVRCDTALWTDFVTGNYEAAFSEEKSGCRETLVERSPFIVHRLAVASNRFADAVAVEAKLTEHLERYGSDALEPYIDGWRGMLLHMEGVRLAAEGDTETAQQKLLQADDYLLYWGNGQGILKMYNLLNLAVLMRRTGDERAAEAIYEKVSSINSHFAEMVTAGDYLEEQLAAR